MASLLVQTWELKNAIIFNFKVWIKLPLPRNFQVWSILQYEQFVMNGFPESQTFLYFFYLVYHRTLHISFHWKVHVHIIFHWWNHSWKYPTCKLWTHKIIVVWSCRHTVTQEVKQLLAHPALCYNIFCGCCDAYLLRLYVHMYERERGDVLFTAEHKHSIYIILICYSRY